MELKEFITTTLTQIAEGVNDAKPVYSKFGAEVNPNVSITNYSGGHKSTCNIDFEVALTDSSKTTAGGGIGVALSIFKAKGEKSTDSESESLTRIKFTVPVQLP